MPIRVLIVLDGGFGFSGTPSLDHDFSYTALVNALTSAGMQVTKAHRGTDPTADLQNFTFPPATLLNFDVLWLIGFEGRNDPTFPPSGSSTIMPAAQLNAIAAFMENGGGVFATGDHDSIGANMSGALPRVRAMRTWFGQDDSARPAGVADLLPNFPPMTERRADTTRTNPAGIYTEHPSPFIWFENQSDSIPQVITPSSSPAHPILRHNNADILVYPDHMHEGRTLGDVAGHDYALNSPFGDTVRPEFRTILGQQERPEIIATGTVPGNAVFAANGTGTETIVADMKSVNTLSVYDGRVAGVGRIVTGSTFHHYVDINLTGDTDITDDPDPMVVSFADKVGHDAMKTHGFNDAPAVFDQIKAVYVNITNWLARPKPAIGLILERSTFSQAEAPSGATFEEAILLTVDGLKPSQFPGGGIPGLGPIAGMPAWVPVISVPVGTAIAIEPTFVDSDDDMSMPDRLQRFTFKYRVHFTGNAFLFGPQTSNVPVTATLNSPAVSSPLTDAATIVLVKSANPFMLDLADGNDTTWLSSDVRVFHVVEGQDFHGIATLPDPCTPDQARSFINTVANNISSVAFTNLPSTEEGSALSVFPMTVALSPKRVYNFALARVRLSNAGGNADDVRVFFRVFRSQTTAALTYQLDGSNLPLDGYPRTDNANPIALPGSQGGQWISFPMFDATRVTPQTSQHDPNNVKQVVASTGFRVFGALVDNNLPDEPYLPPVPGSMDAPQSLSDLITGEHQCIVAQIEWPTTPIPSGATPWTSDKLSQRNLAIHPVANPGLDASRVAMHTFEIEATPHAIGDALPPDELLLVWPKRTPVGTVLRIHIPTWSAQDVVALADRFYARHEIEAIDEHTIAVPCGGTRYVPIPISQHRQTGVISVEFPLGIKKRQRFDVSVRQITNRIRGAKIPPPKVTRITLEEAAKILDSLPTPGVAATTTPKIGAFDLGNNKVLYTDLSYFDAVSDHALIIEHTDPVVIQAAVAESARWREPIGGFQLGIPVSTKEEMLVHHMRLLSVMRWRTARLPRRSRWRKTMLHYLDLLTAKVQALGGNPWLIPATPDGTLPQLPGDGGSGPGGGGGTDDGTLEAFMKLLRTPVGCGLMMIIVLLIVIVVVLLLRN